LIAKYLLYGDKVTGVRVTFTVFFGKQREPASVGAHAKIRTFHALWKKYKKVHLSATKVPLAAYLALWMVQRGRAIRQGDVKFVAEAVILATYFQALYRRRGHLLIHP
jgi:hypothetical protein